MLQLFFGRKNCTSLRQQKMRGIAQRSLKVFTYPLLVILTVCFFFTIIIPLVTYIVTGLNPVDFIADIFYSYGEWIENVTNDKICDELREELYYKKWVCVYCSYRDMCDKTKENCKVRKEEKENGKTEKTL